jgi:hypothetical protein
LLKIGKAKIDADYKNFGLNDWEEAVIALENLQHSGYRLGPRIDLDEAHLRIMIKCIAQFHSAYYAMKINKDPELDPLIKNLKQFMFTSPKGIEHSVYNRMFKIGLERLYQSIAKYPEFKTDETLISTINKFKEKYGNNPDEMMQQRFLKIDDTFTVLLHGDYNRNNVLFQYDQDEGFENPKAIKMIDFQVLSNIMSLAFSSQKVLLILGSSFCFLCDRSGILYVHEHARIATFRIMG